MLCRICFDLVGGNESTIEYKRVSDAQTGRCTASRHMEGAKSGLRCRSTRSSANN